MCGCNPTVKLFTPYKNFSDEEFTNYCKSCYLGHKLDFEFTTTDKFDYAAVINSTNTNDNKFHEIYSNITKKNIIYFQWEPRSLLKIKSTVSFIKSYKSRFIKGFFLSEGLLGIVPCYKFINVNKIHNDRILGIISSKNRSKQHKNFNNKRSLVTKHLYKIPSFDHILTRPKPHRWFKKFKRAIISNKKDISNNIPWDVSKLASAATDEYFHKKFRLYLDYKYVITVESICEKNYITDKLIDTIMCECLCFYFGCPNAADFLDPRCFIQLDINDPVKSIKTIQKCIANNEWEKRLPYILKEKERIYNSMTIVNQINDVIRGDV